MSRNPEYVTVMQYAARETDELCLRGEARRKRKLWAPAPPLGVGPRAYRLSTTCPTPTCPLPRLGNRPDWSTFRHGHSRRGRGMPSVDVFLAYQFHQSLEECCVPSSSPEQESSWWQPRVCRRSSSLLVLHTFCVRSAIQETC